VIVAAGLGNAERVADDKASGLALVRVYGAPHFQPATLAGELRGGPDVTLAGVADPQSQDGGATVSMLRARLAGNGLRIVEPAPPAGFSGGAALDSQNSLVGLLLLRSREIASTAGGGAQAELVGSDVIRKFLEANKVMPAAARAEDVKTSVVRVICVRK
jgi:hypothetical protein